MPRCAGWSSAGIRSVVEAIGVEARAASGHRRNLSGAMLGITALALLSGSMTGRSPASGASSSLTERLFPAGTSRPSTSSRIPRSLHIDDPSSTQRRGVLTSKTADRARSAPTDLRDSRVGIARMKGIRNRCNS